ncbi:MAG TPA: TVP38/TMEM64 family protein [Anaerovoracaceae bacterium]|nr:TVP38/TMEM64 family protein [Anaerovoracaceae bacterium]
MDTLEIKMDKTTLAIRISTILGFMMIGAFVIYGFQLGIFASSSAFSTYILSLGIAAPIIFILVQAIQVIIPILPGAIGCVAGVIAFGPILGLLYSYIGISVGSICAFLISKRYGMPVVRKFVNQKKLNKYMDWLDKGNKFERLLAIAILFPVAPDDLLCFLAGLTKMKLKKFSAIILLCKPPSIALYSLALAGMISLTGF